jgi:hypothetical protein
MEEEVSRPSQAMTPSQFIALLDELCSIGLASRRSRLVDNKSRQETVYSLSLTDIYEADAFLEGYELLKTEGKAE